MSAPRLTAGGLLVYDPYPGGHHVEHLRYLLDWWREAATGERLVLVVPPSVQESVPYEDAGADAVACAPLPDGLGTRANARHQWADLARAVAAHGPRHVFLPYADPVLLPLARGRRLPGRVAWSGLFFRVPDDDRAPGARDRLRDAVKRLLFARLAVHPDLHAVLTLDPRPLRALGPLRRRGRHHAMPDPVPAATRGPEAGAAVRSRYGIDAGRHLCTLFGYLDARKGVGQVIDALHRVPPDVAARIALLVAGVMDPAVRGPWLERLAALRARTGVQVVWDERRLADEEIDPLLLASDTLLLPYQHHVGSSGVQLRAAALGRPALTQATGLVGARARAHRLGLAVDTSSVPVLADALAEVVRHPAAGFDADAARALAREHTPEAYRAVLARVLPARP